MSQNRLGKYLLYAIGEIVLVVIGILIALQINNANQARKDRMKEQALLAQIHRDFKSNKLQLDSIRLNNEKALEGIEVLMQLFPFSKNSSEADSLFKYFPSIMSVKTFNPSNGTVDALISSSSFEVIQNDSLRNLLVSWKDRYRDYQEEEQYVRDFQLWEFKPYMSAHFNFTVGASPENLEQMIKPQFMNMFYDKRAGLLDALYAIEDEGIELYIDEIIRLTSTND